MPAKGNFMNSILQVKDLKKVYEEKVIFEDITFDLYENQIISILGPSGIGKTTLLNIISGIDDEFYGSVNIKSSFSNKKENFAFSQSKDLLIPWKNVLDNAVFGLELSGIKKEKSYPIAKKLMTDFYLDGSECKFPHQLSKGMKQRVSLIRSFLTDRPVLLLDEPFSPLDSITRDDLQDWLINLLKKHNKSVILVTHDIDEALKLSNKLIVLNNHPANIVDEIDINKKSNLVNLKVKIKGLLKRNE